MADSGVTGGCQCGAIRYAITGPLSSPEICHCRMCQKAFGAAFAPLVSVALGDFRITRGELAIFKSSDVADRGFCRNCGTPLGFYDHGAPNIEVAIGSLDDPEAASPGRQVGLESRLSWFADLASLPESESADHDKDQRLKRIAATNHQHPDHDTPSWTPRPSTTWAAP